MTVIISVSEWKQLQQLNKYLEVDESDDSWHSGTETNRVSANWFIQRLVHFACLQQILPLSVSQGGVILTPNRARMFDNLLSRLNFFFEV